MFGLDRGGSLDTREQSDSVMLAAGQLIASGGRYITGQD